MVLADTDDPLSAQMGNLDAPPVLNGVHDTRASPMSSAPEATVSHANALTLHPVDSGIIVVYFIAVLAIGLGSDGTPRAGMTSSLPVEAWAGWPSASLFARTSHRPR